MASQPSLIVDIDSWNKNDAQSEKNGVKKKCLRVSASICDKLEPLEKSESTKNIADDIGITPAIVSRWRHCKDDPQKFDIENCKRARTTAANSRVDEAVYAWYKIQRTQGIPVTDAILKGKAMELNKRMRGDSRFHASDGWLRRWKIRHGTDLTTMDNNLEPLERAAVSSEEKFSKLLQTEMNLNSSQVFNVAVTTLNSKLLPVTPLHRGYPAWGTMLQDCVTVMVCSNVDSTLKLRLLVIGKSAQPRGLKNVKQLAIPIYYAHQENALMNSQIFGDWFVNEFAPSVTRFMQSKEMPVKALLLLDEKDPCSPDLAIGGVQTMLVPTNVILRVATNKHKVIDDLKKRYRLGLLESLSDAQDKGHDPMDYVKNLGMKDIIFRLDAAWTDVSQQIIVDSWCNLLPLMEPLESDPLALEEPTEENVILKLLRKIAGNEEITEKRAADWIRDLERPARRRKLVVIDLMETNDQKQKKMVEEKVISPKEAVEALNSVINFFERHGRLSAIELAALRRARDVAQNEGMKNQK